MKITFIAPRYHTNQHFWVKALQQHGHEVHFLVEKKVEFAEHYDSLEPIKVKTQRLPKLICYVIDSFMRLQKKQIRERLHRFPKWSFLRQLLVSEKPDIVIVRDTGSMLSLATFLMCRSHRIPYILYNQHPLEDREHRLTRWLQALSIAPQVRITPMRKDTSSEHNIKQKSYYVPLISEFSYDISQRKTPTCPIKILFIGKFTLERKKHMLLLESVRALSSRHPIQLTMVGAYHESNIQPYEEAVAFVHEHKLENVVTFKQNVPYEDMPRLYQAHDLFVLPSIDEPFAISPLEAMNFGLPVIITDSNGARGYVKEGETGFIVPSNDQAVLTEKIALLLEDMRLLQKMGRAAHSYVSDQHNDVTFLHYLDTALQSAGVKKTLQK